MPGLLAVLWAAGAQWIPAAYGKPAPVDPTYFRNYKRDVVLVSVAGPIATFAIAVLAGLALRAIDPPTGSAILVSAPPSELARALAVVAYACSGLTVFHLLPIPGLDGARIVALLLPPQAAQVYRNADQYLPLFVLVMLFLFAIRGPRRCSRTRCAGSPPAAPASEASRERPEPALSSPAS